MEELWISWRAVTRIRITGAGKTLKPEQENNSSWKQIPGLSPPSGEFSAPPRSSHGWP